MYSFYIVQHKIFSNKVNNRFLAYDSSASDVETACGAKRGRILGRNWDKSLKSFPPCDSQSSPLYTNGFYSPPPPPWAKVVWNWFSNVNIHCIGKPQVSELSRLCPETSTKLYVHEFGLDWLDITVSPVFCLYFRVVGAWGSTRFKGAITEESEALWQLELEFLKNLWGLGTE
jgi:hypothetical protein